MTRVDDGLFQYGGQPVGGLMPVGPNSQVYWVDPANGNNGNDGLTPKTAFASVATAYGKTTSGNNDVIYFIGGSTADTLAAALTWSNSYTHLIGLSNGLPGLGNRCRVIGGATTDLTSVITVSGTGCLFLNISIKNETDADADSGALVVSGARNAFVNCEIAGMLDATPAARAASYSLTVSGAENSFKTCYVGADTITRAAANAELVMSGSKNTFTGCTFASRSETIGHFAVKVTGAGTNYWKDCLFHNMSVNWATTLTDAFATPAGAPTYYVILQWPYQFVGYTGVADNLTHVYLAGPAPSTGSGLSTNPAG